MKSSLVYMFIFLINCWIWPIRPIAVICCNWRNEELPRLNGMEQRGVHIVHGLGRKCHKSSSRRSKTVNYLYNGLSFGVGHEVVSCIQIYFV